jgi:hypothetical protein
MTHLTAIPPYLVDETVLIDVLALFLSIGTGSLLWDVFKKIYPDEVKDLSFILTFIGAIVPFVMLIYFGLAVINYDAIAARAGWPPALPLSGNLFSPLIIGAAAFFIGQTAWLWLQWRKL